MGGLGEYLVCLVYRFKCDSACVSWLLFSNFCNFCCSRALAYTTLDKLWSVFFLYIIANNNSISAKTTLYCMPITDSRIFRSITRDVGTHPNVTRPFLFPTPPKINPSYGLVDFDDLCVIRRVSTQGCAFWWLRWYCSPFRGSNRPKSQFWGRI